MPRLLLILDRFDAIPFDLLMGSVKMANHPPATAEQNDADKQCDCEPFRFQRRIH
ncbi:MAG: hypothetical protein WCL32_07165 [Planctomycetota bacterium]